MSGFPSSLPGIDVASGLARLGGNEKLYVKLLLKMANDLPVIQERISEALMTGDAGKAKEAAHALKGAAGNLSMVSVAEIAAQLEEAAGREDFSAMFSQLDALDKAMQEYLTIIEALNA